MRRTFRRFELARSAVLLLCVIGSPLPAQTAAAKAKAKADSIRADSIRTDSIKKASAKKGGAAATSKAATAATKAPTTSATAATTKAATTSSKPATTAAPATTKAATTSSKPATTSTAAAPKTTGTAATKPASGTSATKAATSDTKAASTAPATGAPAKTSGASTGSSTSRPAATSTRTPAAAAKASSTGTPRPQEPAAYTSVSLYGGMAKASLGFGNGISAGLALRIKRASLPVVFRFDVGGSRFSQTPTAFGGTTLLNEKAALTHAGATASLEIPLINHGSIRPYIVAGGGVFRFQANGPAGNNGTISDGVFTSTTDGALNAGGGVFLGRHLFVEARYISVGDFNSIAVVLGLVFR